MSSAEGFYSNTTRLRWLPDPRVAPHAQAIEERVAQFSTGIRAANFMEFLDPLMQRLVADCFRDARVHEGVIWMLDGEGTHLLCACQVGPASSRLLNFRLPLDTGLASMVLAMQQPFCENHLAANRQAPSRLEERLGVIMCSRILVPFFIAGKARGVVAAYQTKTAMEEPDPAGFEPDAVEEMSLLARLLGRLLDHKLLCAAIGLEED